MQAGFIRRTTRPAVIGTAVLTTVLALTTPGAAAPRDALVRGSTSVAHVPSSSITTVTAAPRIPRGTRVLGPLAASTSVTGAIALRLPDPDLVTRFIDAVSDPRSPSFHHYLARGQFATLFGPSPATIAAVRHLLRADGLRATGVSANHILVSFSGSAARAEAAFHTGLVRVRLADGSLGRATTAAVRLPGAVARDVQAVVGLDQLVRESNGLQRSLKRSRGTAPAGVVRHSGNGGPAACSTAIAQQALGALTDQQVATSYGVEPLYGAGDLASGQTIDVYELEPFFTSDLQGFEQCYFGADHTGLLTVSAVDGGPGTGPGSGEAALDVEDVAAIAPGAHIHVFSGPNMDNPFGPLDTWNSIAVADDARQITSSWGVCETEAQEGSPGVPQVENEIFEQTAAQGQTVFSSAGDDGSDDCSSHASTPVAADLSLDDPSSQPYVTSVGGTTILNATEPPVETVWNNGTDGGAGGGGISELWAMQPWQASVAVSQTSATEPCSNDPSGTADSFHLQGIGTTLQSGTPCREAPDVSALADPQTGITIEWDGQWFPIGGTSSSTPLWAAMLAEVNGSSGCSGLANGVGFADPLLYQVASSSPADYGAAFSDVTIGNNDNLGVGDAVDWQAGTGYDLATGLGTPRLTDANGSPGLASQLCTLASGTEATAPPSVSSLSSSTGPVTGGRTTTISGTNFGASTGSVYFGSVTASITSWAPTSITVNVPAYFAPAASPAGTAGSADITVVTAGPPPESSLPGHLSVYHYVSATSSEPVVDYVSSPTGPTAGGNDVTIVGGGFMGATAVHFGDVAATILSVASNSDNELSVMVPASDSTCAVPAAQGICAVAVTVTTPSGTSSSPVAIQAAYQGPIVFAPDGSFAAPPGCSCEVVPVPDEYDYAPTPTISNISPAFASENGGTTATITGTGFNLLSLYWTNVGTAGAQTSEDFGIEGVTPDTLTISLPSANASTEATPTPLSVQTSGGLSSVSSVDYAGTPTLTSISAHVAAQAAPGTLNVTGTGLSDVDSVVLELQGELSFLSSTSTAITNQTDSSLTVAIPQGYAAPADVLVCSASGCSFANPAVDTLTLVYRGRPVVSSSGPSSGPAHGGTIVTIHGSLDSEVTAVHFGSALAIIESEPELSASGPITVVAPPGRAGSKVDITISTLGGTIAQPVQPTSAVTSRATFSYATSTPGAPIGLAVTVGVKSLDARWKSPTNNGGDSLTGYLVVAVAARHKSVVVHVSATTHSTVVPGLAAGVAWTVSVRAVNKLGAGLAATGPPRKPAS